jgi:hypothetical protein
MTPSSNETLERIARRIPIREPAYERMIRRRDRKRRNQRIAAGVVGIAVFVAAVWVVTSVGSFDRTQTPAVPGPTQTGPTVAPDTRVPESKDNSYRIPPEGAALSTPVEGELIAEAYAGFAGQVRVYADGRVISTGHNGGIIVERRLSPEGVELVRQVLGERVYLGYGPGAVRLESLLGYSGGRLSYSGGIESRQSVWEDREGKPYVPARYWACFRRTDLPIEAVLDLLPASAQALLRGSDPAWNPRCFVVTPEEARSLEAILSEAGSFNGDPWPWAVGAWSLPDGKGDQFGISLRPLFPDGRRFFRVAF